MCFSGCDLPLVQVDIGFLADQIRVSAPNTLDLSQGVHDLLLSIDVRIEKSEDELEVRLLSSDERCDILSASPQNALLMT